MRCSVATCSNNSKKVKKNGLKISFHCFPRNPKIRKEWIIKCKRKGKWNPGSCHVCSDHFSPEDFKRDLQAELLGYKAIHRLHATAVPNQNLPSQVLKSECPSAAARKTRNEAKILKELQTSTVEGALQEDAATCEAQKEEISALKQLLKECQDKVKGLENEIQLLKTKNEKSVEAEMKNILCKAFSKNQIDLLMKKKKSVHWTTDEISKAFTLRCMSKRAYVYVKSVMKLPLPGVSSLQRWTSRIEMRRDILPDVMRVLKVTGMDMDELPRLTVIDSATPNDGLGTKKLESCTEKDDEEIAENSNFQVFAESIVAEKSEADDGDVNCGKLTTDCYEEITISPVKIEFEENDIYSNGQESCSNVTALEDNTGNAMGIEHCERDVKEGHSTQLVEEANAGVSSTVLRPKRARSYSWNQSDSENSEGDQSSYQVSPDEMSESDVEEAATVKRNVHRKTGKKVHFGKSLSRRSVTEDSDPLVSTSENDEVVGGLSDGLRIAECSSDTLCVKSVEMDVPKQGNEIDPFESGNQNQVALAKNDKFFLCDECGKKFKNLYTLNEHIQGIHSCEEVWECKICSKSFKSKHLLYYHSLCHREAPRFCCLKCGKGFQLKNGFEKHLKTHGLKLFQCVHCSVDCGDKEQLEVHYQVHDGKVDWTCYDSGEKCRKWSDFATHRTTHEAERVFKGGTSGVEYSRNDTLGKQSNRTANAYFCPVCSKLFSSKYNLRMHSYTHDGVKPHECNVCNRRFRLKGCLSRHLMTHSEDRLFPCNFCSYRGKSTAALNDHQLKHSTSKPYKCSFCDRTYLRNKHKLEHERKSHGDKMAK